MDCLGLLGCDLFSKLYFGLYEAVRGRLIGPKLGIELLEFFWSHLGSPRTVCGLCRGCFGV